MEQAQKTVLLDAVAGHGDLRHEVLEVAAGVVGKEAGCQLGPGEGGGDPQQITEPEAGGWSVSGLQMRRRRHCRPPRH